MGKATKPKKAARTAGTVHPLIAQADIPKVQKVGRAYEVARVPNPHGEAIVRGELRQHTVVRVKPAFRELFERRTFDKLRVGDHPNPRALIMAALEWYDARLDLAQSGMTRCGIAALASAGGDGSVAMPTTQAAMEARSDVAWVRKNIPPELLTAFDAVMIEGERFAETARRQCAQRYVRVSVERQRKKLAKQFLEAVTVFARAWDQANLRQRSRLLAQSWEGGQPA